MKNENYINIQGWMTTRLGLKGNPLVIYAMIYGFSQDGESAFNGSLNYIARAVSVSKQTVINILNKLIKDKYIIKKQSTYNGVKSNRYFANTQLVQQVLQQNLTLNPRKKSNTKQSPHRSLSEVPVRPENFRERRSPSPAERSRSQEGEANTPPQADQLSIPAQSLSVVEMQFSTKKQGSQISLQGGSQIFGQGSQKNVQGVVKFLDEGSQIFGHNNNNDNNNFNNIYSEEEKKEEKFEKKKEFSTESKKEKKLIFPFHSSDFMLTWENWRADISKRGKPYQDITQEQAALQLLSIESEGNEQLAIQMILRAMSQKWLGIYKINNTKKISHGNKINITPEEQRQRNKEIDAIVDSINFD